ncbi:MAG: glycosyl hydrolase [Acidobacteria bacterium]|nr:glycosyl hydrolase [Acidobacteriota bacterium]
MTLLVLILAADRGPDIVRAQGAAVVDPALYASLKWRSVGPYRGGIAHAVAGDPANPYVFYMGIGGGGVWKTDDTGLTWRNVSDGYFTSGGIGAIAVASSNPNIVYVGTGEACMRHTTSAGDGMYRSNDGGKTWARIGLEKTEHIARVVIHPSNPDLVYVAAFGDSFAPNPDRGVYRSKDGGKTWEKVLYKSDKAGAIDLVMTAEDPNTLYAALWEFQNFPWANKAGGPGSGIHKSTDGGTTWVDITNNPGLPKGLKGKIGIDVSASKPGRVWAIMTAEGEGTGVWPPKGLDLPAGWKPCRDYICAGSGLYRSDDGGATWALMNNDLNYFSRAWYYTHVTADPVDPDKAYILFNGVARTTDGGKTARHFRGGDTHDWWIDPKNPNRMIAATDGGASITLNGGATWSSLNNQPTGKFYRVTTDDRFPYRIYGGQQDGPTHSIPTRPDLSMPPTFASGGGENAVVAVNRTDPDITYGGDHHWVSRLDRKTGQRRWISPSPENNYGTGPKQLEYRFAWWFPVFTSSHDPKAIYVAAQVLFKSTNDGQTWNVISPDLTLHDPATLEDTLPSDPGENFSPTTRENLTQWYSAIISFSESPKQRGIIWTGSSDGKVYVTRDDAKTWNDVTPPDVKPHTHVSTVEASPHDPATAYVAATRYQMGDDTPYLYKTNDYGRTWTKITSGIAADDYTRTIREDPVRRGLLYAGAEHGGVHVSFNDGATWQSLRLNLPTVPVWDVAIKDNDLLAATHGRSYWVLEDLTVLRQLHAQPAAQTLRLFQPATTVRLRGAGGGGEEGGGRQPSGAAIRYYLKDKPEGEVTLSILDDKGSIVRSFSSVEKPAPDIAERIAPQEPHEPAIPAAAGANAFVWDLRHKGIAKIPSALIRRGDPPGPFAVPGKYQVRLTAGGDTQTQPLEIVKDPRLQTTQADFEEQLAFGLQVRDKANEMYRVIAEIRNIRQQVAAIARAPKGASGSAKKLADAGASIDKKLWGIEDMLIQFRVETNPPAAQSLIAWPVKLNDKLTLLMEFTQAADYRPTDPDREVFSEVTSKAADQYAALQQLVRVDLAAFNRLVRQVKGTEVTLKYMVPKAVSE